MKVTIPKTEQHEGNPFNLVTIEISDKCPKCGAKRGVKRWEEFSYDGSCRLNVDCWINECEHIDKYSDVIEEYKNAFFRPITRGLLMDALREGTKCEVVTSNVEITSKILEGWSPDIKFNTYPSLNEGWTIFEKI